MTDLLDRLRDAALPPSTVDIARAVTAGRRRVRRRRVAASTAVCTAIAGLVLAAAAVPRSAPEPDALSIPSRPVDQLDPPAWSRDVVPRSAGLAPPTKCAVHRLTLPAGYAQGIVVDGDPTGRYLVGHVFERGSSRPVLWTNGVPTVINAPYDNSIAVNSAGLVVGSGSAAGGEESRAWTYRSGKLTMLGGGTVVEVNTRGDILTVVGPREVVVRTAEGAIRRLADAEGGPWDFSGGIDDDGTVVGGARMSGEATMWSPAGRPEPLTGDQRHTTAIGIRLGWVVGGSGITGPDNPGAYHVVRWDVPTGALTTYPSMVLGGTHSVNSRGWIAGATADRAVAAFGERIMPLPVPAGTTSGAGTHATTISDNGRILGGQASLSDGRIVPLRWTCA